MDPWNSLGVAASFLSKDINYAQVLAAKKTLQLLADNKDTVIPIVQLCLACCNNDVYSIKELLTDNKGLLNTADGKGLTPLIYSICFHNKECVELLLTFNVDCNEPDNLIGWSPAMWATHLDYEDLLERLISFNADPLKKVGKSMKNALDLVKPGSKTYEYYKIHGYLNNSSSKDGSSSNSDFYKNDVIFTDENNHVQSTIIGINNMSLNQGQDTRFVDEPEVVFDTNMDKSTFNFNIVQSKQYLKFSDDSIRGILDYIFQLPFKYHNKPLYPSSILFQCLRYAEHKLQSGGMVQNMMDLYLTRIRNVTGTKSGVVQFVGEKEKKEREKRKKKEKDTTPDPPAVDIVTISYWISALNHLHYFLLRDSACNFLGKYPQLLQELILCLQSLISKLAFTLDARLEPLLEPCILEYNSVPDLEVMYKNQWKIFKNKSTNGKKTSYEEIIDMLYPPSYSEQMKPSPLKIIQTLGALLYVLELFYINDVIKQQCFSAVLYFIGSELFNKVLSNKRYCSRVKAMEIRLNLSYLQDWLRTNNLQPFIEEDSDFSKVLSWKGDGFPDNLIDKPYGYLTNVSRFNGDERDPFDATYYMNSLYKIGQYSLQPIVELAEWLQVLTGIKDLEGLRDIIDKFEVLASSSMVQCIRNYNYEVDEKKFSKTLKKWLKENSHNEGDELKKKGMFYKDDTMILLNHGQAFPVTLPKLVQLLHQYGADFKHVNNRKLFAYQPNIPLDIRDDIETIVDESNEEREERYQEAYTDDDDTADEYNHKNDKDVNNENNNDYDDDDANAIGIVENKSMTNLHGNENGSPWGNADGKIESNFTAGEQQGVAVRGGKQTSDLFTELSLPTTVAHKTWQDDSNPWA